MTKIHKKTLPWFEDGIAIVGFFIIIGIFFSPTIFQGKLPVPLDSLVGLYHPWRDLYSKDYPRGIPFKNFLITDPVRQQIPWRKIAIDQWKEGKIPLWNPYNFSGTPILANIQTAALYPLNILFLIFPFIDAWTMLIMLQSLLAGLFMYWYLRSLALRSVASLLGAIAWSFSGFNIAWLTWGTMGHVALWLPLTLLAIDKSWYFLLVFSLVFQFFAGHAQISFYFILVIIAYAVMRKRAGFRFIVLLSLVALITSVQWIPFLEWIRQSGRVVSSADWMKEGWFIPWVHLAQFVAPDFFGNPTTLNYWGQWNYGEFIGYIGILPLVFVFIAILSQSAKKYRFWIGIVVVALLFALPTLISYLPFVLKVPILSSIQPTRLLFLVDFSLAVLAAYGSNAFIENSKNVRWGLVIVSIGVVLGFLWGIIIASRLGIFDASIRVNLDVSASNLRLPTLLYIGATMLLVASHRLGKNNIARNVLLFGFVVLVAADLLRFGWKFTPFTPKEYFFPETAIISFLKKQPKPFRVMSVDKRLAPPNTLSFWGIESIEGYDPIISSRYEEFMAAVARGKPDIAPPFGFHRIITLDTGDSPLVPMMNVRYILTLSDLTRPYFSKVFEEGETRVYEDTRVFPRAYLASHILTATTKQEAIEDVLKSSVSKESAVVEENVRVDGEPLSPDETASVVSYEINELRIQAYTRAPRLLVIANGFDEHWKAYIDSQKTQIVRANYIFQGIVLPEGSHSVDVIYR